MSSQVSLITRDGGGRLASGAAQSSSHRPTIAPTASTGGSKLRRCRFAAASARDPRDVATSARGAGAGAALEPAPPACALSGTTLDSWTWGRDLAVELMRSARALDREAREVPGGIRRGEHLAVEQRLAAAAPRL